MESRSPRASAPNGEADTGGRGGRGGGRGGRGFGGLSDGAGSQSAENAGYAGERGRTFGDHGRNEGEGDGDGPRQRPVDGQPAREPRPRRPNEIPHVPKKRTVEEILEEDARVKDKYRIIRDEDEDIKVTGPQSDRYSGKETWPEFEFEPELLANINKSNYIRPRKIQSFAIPLILAGLDVKGHAETGSGKSAAFLLPIIDDIMKKKKRGEFSSKRSCPYALILEPTRELTNQLYEQTMKLAKDCDVSVSRAYGCFTRHANMREISDDGCDIIIGTPGRLWDFFSNKYLLFEKLKVIVFDEADELLEPNFLVELRQFEKIKGWPSVKDRQTLLFSATFSPIVQKWADEWMRADSVMVSNEKLVAANSRIQQRFMVVNKQNKKDTLLRLLQLEMEKAGRNTDDLNPKIRKTMVFVNTKREADLTSAFLNQHDLRSTTINGDRPQEMREQALSEFRAGIHQVIVTTDVCARGHDIKQLDHVINMDLPPTEFEYATYVQRIGRTGRLTTGYATSFFDPQEDMGIVKELVEGLKKGCHPVPEWLQKVADGKPIDGQGVVSDQDLVNSAAFPPMAPSIPPIMSPLSPPTSRAPILPPSTPTAPTPLAFILPPPTPLKPILPPPTPMTPILPTPLAPIMSPLSPPIMSPLSPPTSRAPILPPSTPTAPPPTPLASILSPPTPLAPILSLPTPMTPILPPPTPLTPILSLPTPMAPVMPPPTPMAPILPIPVAPTLPPFDFLSGSPPQYPPPPTPAVANAVIESIIVDLGHTPSIQDAMAKEASICPLSPPHYDWSDTE